MDTAALFRHVPTIFVTVCLLAYVTYNFVRGGAYARGKGWQSKEEAPKSYYLTQGILILISFGQIASIIFYLYK
jgi:hypothetical protein